MTDCIGCRDIADERFPFCRERYQHFDGPRGKYAIDTESCGSGPDPLPIDFCPVCGVKLTPPDEPSPQPAQES